MKVVGGVAIGPVLCGAAVVHIPIIPLVKEPTSPPLVGCANSTVTSDALKDTRHWSQVGLYEHGKSLRDSYEVQLTLVEPQLRHLESEFKRRLQTEDDYDICETRQMSLNPDLSYAAAFCQCSSQRTAESNCMGQKRLVERTQCYSDFQFDTVQCDAINELLATTAEIAPSCTVASAGSASSLDLNMQNLLFPAGSMLPEYVDQDANGFKVEGRTLYLAYMGIQRFTRYADSVRFCPSPLDDFEIIPGWNNTFFLDPIEEGETAAAPMIAFSRRGHENFLITVRDAQTTFEGRLYAQYNEGFSHAALDKVKPVKEGVSSLLAASLAPLNMWFDDFFKAEYNLTEFSYETTLTHPRILVVGSGGLGAGVAAGLAEYLASKWMDGDAYPFAKLVKVEAVLFNAPRMGSSKFVDSYRTKVNGRNIVSKYAAGNFLPCESQMYCDADHGPVATGNLGVVGNFAALGGTVLIDVDSEKGFHNDDAFGWDDPSSRLDLVAQDVCAPKCWLTTEFCTDDVESMCSPVTCPVLGD